MTGRKRKADDELVPDERMSTSPSASPSTSSRPLPPQNPHRHLKRVRTNVSGRPLTLPRLLETLNAEELRTVLQRVCERHPDLATEVASQAPRPSATSALEILRKYESAFQSSFPFGGRTSSDYAYNRVRQSLIDLLEALKDYTPNFLPPNELQTGVSLKFLDGVTEMIHNLPDWDSYQNNRHKSEAYEEMSKAWAVVIREAAKRGAGIQLQYGGWDQKLAKHNEMSGGKMEDAVNELKASIGWMGNESAGPATGTGPTDPASIRQQLFNGTYGLGAPVRVGPW